MPRRTAPPCSPATVRVAGTWRRWWGAASPKPIPDTTFHSPVDFEENPRECPLNALTTVVDYPFAVDGFENAHLFGAYRGQSPTRVVKIGW